MKTLWHLLPLLLIACASQAPTQYAQGAPGPMMAPAFNPVESAPITVGQPGYIGPAENLPRSPHRRVLPQTPETRLEPGIWAASQPKTGEPPYRAPGSPVPQIKLLGFDVPLHESIEDGAWAMPAEQCAHVVTMDLWAGDMGLMQRAMALDPLQRECLAALAHYGCLQRVSQAYKKDPKRKQWLMDAFVFTMERNIRWIRSTCPTASETKEIPNILSKMGTTETKTPPQWRQ